MKENPTAITIKCTYELKEALEAEAKRQQRPLSNLVKIALQEYIDNHIFKKEKIE